MQLSVDKKSAVYNASTVVSRVDYAIRVLQYTVLEKQCGFLSE